MTYQVVVTPEAEKNLRDAYLFIRRDSPEAASQWSKGARRAIRSLSRFPGRCAVAWESGEFNGPIRELLYGFGNRGTFRILFTMIKETVFILHVRHGSMRQLLIDD